MVLRFDSASCLCINVTHILVSTNSPNSSKSEMRRKKLKNPPLMGHPHLLRPAYAATTPSRTDILSARRHHSNEPVLLPLGVLKRRTPLSKPPMTKISTPASSPKTTCQNLTNPGRSMATMRASRSTEIRVLGTPGKGVTTHGGLATQANGEVVIRWRTCQGRWEGWTSNSRDNLHKPTMPMVVHGLTRMRVKPHPICNSSNIWTDPSSSKDATSNCTPT